MNYKEFAEKVLEQVDALEDLQDCTCPKDPETGLYSKEFNPDCWYSFSPEKRHELRIESLANRLEVILGQVSVQD